MNKNIFLFLCFFSLLSLGIQAPSCNPTQSFPPQLTLYTGETFRYYLMDYFNGPSLSFTTSSSLSSYSRIVPTYTAPTTSSNAIPAFISYKIYKTPESMYQSVGNSMAFLIKNNTGYYVQAFTPQTMQSPITNLTGAINLNGTGLPADAICYDLAYITIGQVLVDCYSPTNALNYLVPVSLSAQVMLNNTMSFPEYSSINATIAASMKRNLMTVSVNNQIYLLRYVYSQYLAPGSNTYIAVFNVRPSITQTYGPRIIQFPPISASAFKLTNFQLQNLVLKNQYLYLYEASSQQILITQLTFQGINIQLPKIASIPVNATVPAMDAFFDGQNYTFVYALTGVGIFEFDWTSGMPYNTLQYQWNPKMVNLNKLVVGQQFIMIFFNDNSTTNVMEIYARGSVAYPMLQFYNTSFFRSTSVLDMDQVSGAVYSFGNSYSASNTNQMIQLQLPFVEFQSSNVQNLANFTFNCAASYNTQTSQSATTFQVQSFQAGQVSITSQSGSTVGSQTLTASYPGQAYDDLSRYYKGPGLQYTFQSLNTNPWTPNAKIANIDNYVSKNNFKFVLSNQKTLDPSTIIFLKQIQFYSGIYIWYVQDTSNTMYTFVQNYESNEEYIETYEFQYQWTDPAINIEMLEPQIAIFAEGTSCNLYFYNTKTLTFFSQTLCDSSKYKINYFNLIGNQIYVSINDKNSTSTTRLNGQLLTATITLADFTSNSAFNLIQWNTFSSLQSLTHFYPQLVYQPWNTLYPVVYIQAEQSTIVLNTQFNKIYNTITPASTPYQLAFTQNYIVLIESSQIEQYQVYNPVEIYKTINYPIYSAYQKTPCYSTTPQGLQFSQNLTLVYDQCNSQIVVFAPQKDENQVSQYLIPVTDFNFFTLARTYKIPNVITILGKNSLNLINYYQFEFLGINAYLNPQQTATSQTFNFQIIVSSAFSKTITQTIPYTFVNILNPLYSIHQSSTALIDYGNQFIPTQNATIVSYKISPYQWYKGMISNFSVSCSFKDTNYYQSCGKNVNLTNTFSKNRTISGVPAYFNALVKKNNFHYAQSSNKLFRIYNYTNNFFDFVQLPFNTRYGGSCYAVGVSDNEQFAVSACLNGTWRLYITSFLSSEPTVAGSFEIQTPLSQFFIHKIIIKDLYVFIVFGGFTLKDGFDYVQILKLNFDNFLTTKLFTPITNFTLTANKIYYGTENIITSLDIQQTRTANTYRFFITDYFGNLYTHLFTPATPSSYFSYFLKFNLFFHLGSDILAVKPLLTGFQIFNYIGQTEDTYTGVLAFSTYHSYEVTIAFSSATQAFAVTPQNQYLQYGIYEFTGNMDIMNNPVNNTDGFAVLFAVLPDRFINDPNYATHPKQILIAYDRSNKSYTASQSGSVSYPSTIMTGSYNFQSDEPNFAFLAKAFPGNNASMTNFSVLLINPDTFTLDNLYITRYIQIDLNTTTSDQSWTLALNAQNTLNLQSYIFSLKSELTGGGQLSTTQTCAGYQMFNPTTITQSETARFNLLDYFSGPNIAYTISQTTNAASIPSFVQNFTSSASQGIVPYYTAYRTYKPWNAFTMEWKQQMAVLFYDYVTSTYAIQQFNVPSKTAGMTTVGQPIVLNFNADVICFDLEYIDQNTIIVDCHSPTKYVNYFAVVSSILSSSPSAYYQSSIPYQSLTSPPLKRHLYLFQSSPTVSYIFRCQYAEDYVTEDYQLAQQSYIEQFSYSNSQIIQLFPITASALKLTSLQIDQLIVTPIGQLFILTQSAVYKVSPSFLGISLTPYEIDSYSSIYIQNIQRMALNFNGTQLILYLALQLSDSNNYIQEIDWTTSYAMKLTSRITVNQYIGQVTQMSVSNDFIIMAYNNQNFQNWGSYLDIYSIAYGQNVYQTPFSNMQNFTHDRFNNYLLILENTRSKPLNKQQMYSISIPYLYLQSASAVPQQTYTIGCTSSYYTIGQTTSYGSVLPVATPQATENLMMTILSQNSIQLTSLTAGVYSAIAQTQAPGQAIMDLTKFYTGPSIQYTFQGTGSAATWPTDTKIYSFNTAYQSSSFVFKDKRNNKTISVSDVIFFQQYSIAPDFMFWFVQDKTFTMYMFEDIIADDQIIELEPHPVSLSSQLVQLDFATMDVSIVLEQNYNCTLFFYNRKKSILFSKNFCNSSSTASVTSFKVLFESILYVTVQNGGNNFVSQVFFEYYNFHNNTAFSWLYWNQITSTSFLNVQQLTNFVPQNIYQSTLQPGLVILKCSSYILIFNQFTYHIYAQIAITTSYQIAVTANDYLTIIQPTQIIEYNFQNPLNIFQSKGSYPSYAGATFSTTDSDIKRTDKFVYIRQPSKSQILTIQPGNPMLSAVQNTIPLTADFQFFSVEKSFANIFETIAVFGTNSLQVYNFYIQKSLEITAQSLATAGNLTFNIAFQSAFEATASHTLNFTLSQTPNTQMFSIAQQQSATVDYAGFINVETFSGQGVFQFLPHQWYSGVITNYGINCSESCSKNVILQAPVGLQRQISKDPYFIDVTKGKTYTYAQSANKVYRLYTYNNQIFDMVPLPFSVTSKQCYTITVAPTEYYTLSACFDGESWVIYMVSFLSSEPHVSGSFKVKFINHIHKMIIQNNYLFILDAAENIQDKFNGIHIFYLNFTPTSTFNQWANYIDTFTLDRLSSKSLLSTINYVDIQQAELTNSYRFFLADSFNYLHTVLFQPNQPSRLEYYQNQQSLLITHYLDSEAQQQKNIELIGVKAFNAQISSSGVSPQAIYSLIIVFKNFHSYETKISFSTHVVQNLLINKFLLNGFYQSQHHFDIMDYNNDGFFILQGILPQRIAENSSYSSLSQQVLMVYDRTNTSLTQTASSQVNSTIVMATYSFNTLNPMLKFIGQIYPGAITNYSILAISPVDFSFNNLYVQRNAQFVVNAIDFNDSSLDLILSNDVTNAKYTFNITKEQGQNGTLANTQCASLKDFPAITLGISEYYKFKLADYFSGENLQFNILPATQTMISINNQFKEYPNSGAYGVLDEFNYISILKTVNSSFVAWDNYAVTLTQSSFSTPSYMATKYILPTESTPMQITGPQINFTLNSGSKCYEIVHVTADIAVVDCIDMTNNVNMLIIVDFSKNTSTIQTQPWLQVLISAPLWRQFNIMTTQSGMFYLYRTIYTQYYSTQDKPYASSGYIEVFSYYNGKISELFPFTASTFGMTLLEIQQIWTNQNSVFIFDKLTSKIFKLTPTFISLTYPVYYQDAYTVPGNFMSFSVTPDGAYALVATTVNSINYLYQVSWQQKMVIAQYFLNSNIQQITEIFGTEDFIAVEYNNGQSGLKFIGYIDFYQTNSAHVSYQRQISQVEYFLYNPFKNQILIVYDTQQQQSNYVSLWQLTPQELVLSATQAATQQQVTIECSSVYYIINGTQSYKRRLLSPAINISFAYTVQPANTVVVNTVVPPGDQTLYTQYPGSLSFGINYYEGPLLQYKITNISLPTNTQIILHQNFLLYQNQNFNFTIGSTTLYPSDVTNFFEQILIEPGVFLWVFQDKSYNTYKQLVDVRSGTLQITDISSAKQTLPSTLINLQKVFPFIVAFALQNSPCVLTFANLDKGYNYDRSFCTGVNEKIQNFNIIGNYIYVYTTQSNIYSAKLNLTQFFSYSGFQSIQWAQINNLIADQTVKTALQTCMPSQLLPYQSNGVTFIQCASSIMIMNLQTLVYYTTIKPKTATAFIPTLVQQYLLLVEPTNIEEYDLTSLTNIYKTKDYPTYGAATLSYTKVSSCTYYAAIYEANSHIIYIVKPGSSIFSVMASSISVPADVFFMQCMPGVETSILTVISSATNGGAVSIYKLYEAYPQMVMNFGVNNFSTNLGASFQLEVSSSLQTTALAPIKFNTIASNQTELTLSLNKTQPSDFYHNLINLGYQKDRSYYFDFKQQTLYHGLILNFYIRASVKEETNKTIRLDNIIDWQRTIARTKQFTDVAQGNTGKFAYALSRHEIWRFLGYMDELYDMVQLPLSDPNIYCTKLAMNELDQFAVAACTASDITSEFATPMESFWELYVVSYISTEPFTMGNFPIKSKFINKMVILDKYLFVFDADESIETYFSGIHVYSFNFNNFTLYPTWYQYVGTLTREDISFFGATNIITSCDVQKTAIPGRYRFIFSSFEGYMLTQTYDLTAPQPFANYIEFYTIYVNSMMNNQQQTNSKLQSITFFNLQTQTSQSSGDIISVYNALFVFQNISSYEAKLTFNENKQSMSFDVVTEYLQYGYYQSQPNAKVVDNFILFSGVLPEYLLQTAPPTTAKQVLFVYQRNNASGTQFTNLQKTQNAVTIVSSGYPFYNSLNQFPFSPQAFYNRTSAKTNYSMLMINPDTRNLDRFWLKENLTFDFVNNSITSSSVYLYARNDFMTIYCGKFDISIMESPGSSKKHPYWVIGVVLGSVALVAILVFMYLQYRKRNRAKNELIDQTPLNE